MQEYSLFGVKAATAVAGFAGAVVSLQAIKPLSRWQAMLAVMTGAAVAGYGTPVVAHYLALTAELQNGVAFFLGLTAMHIVPGLIRIGELFRNDPLALIGRGKGGGHE